MKIWDKENTILTAILLYCFILTYFLPMSLSRIGFLPLLFFAYKSKNSAMWLVLFLVLIDNPAYFFLAGAKDAIGRAPYYQIGPGMIIAFEELLNWVLILKAFKNPKNPILYAHSIKKVIGVFFIALIISLAFTFSLDQAVKTFRNLSIFVLIITIPRLLFNEKQWFSFFKLLYPLVFFTFISQIHTLITGIPLAGLFANVKIYGAMREVIVGSERISRIISGITINFISFSSSLAFITSNRKIFLPKKYLAIIAILCFVQIFISATRGWFIAYTIMTLLFFGVGKSNSAIKSIFSVVIIIVTVLFLFQTSGILKTQTQNSFNRMLTVAAIAEGDATARGTLSRLTIALPKVIENIKGSPFIGYGFSTTAKQLINTHIGMVSPIINFGIIGYGIILFFIFGYMHKLYNIQNKVSFQNPYKNMTKMGVFSFIGIFVIHLTSRQMFGYNYLNYINFLIVFIFAMTNWFAVSALKYENKMRKIKYEN